MRHHFKRNWQTDGGRRREVRIEVDVEIDYRPDVMPFIPPGDLTTAVIALCAADLLQRQWLIEGHDYLVVVYDGYKGIFRVEEWGRTTGIEPDWYVVLSVTLVDGPRTTGAPEHTIDVDFEDVKPKRLNA